MSPSSVAEGGGTTRDGRAPVGVEAGAGAAGADRAAAAIAAADAARGMATVAVDLAMLTRSELEGVRRVSERAALAAAGNVALSVDLTVGATVAVLFAVTGGALVGALVTAGSFSCCCLSRALSRSYSL